MNRTLNYPNLQTHILSRYPFTVREITPVRKVLRLTCNNGSFALKRVTKRPEKITFIYHLILHLYRQGLRELPALVPAKDGSLYVEAPDGFYYMTEWIEGRECLFDTREEVFSAAALLARFHRAAAGFTPPQGVRIPENWARLPRTMVRRLEELEKFFIKARQGTGSFDALFQKAAPIEIDYGKKALATLQASNYKELAAGAREAKTLCHMDFARNNLLVKEGHLYIIDLDNCKFDLHLRDLEKFVRRSFIKDYWDIGLVRGILEAYHAINPPEQGSSPVFGALMAFPHPLWRLAKDYYGHPGTKDNKALVGALSHYWERLPMKNAFLASLKS